MGATASSNEKGTSLQSEEDIHKFWSQVPLFRCLPVEVHPELTQCSEKVYFGAGEVIIQQGEVGHEFFVIKSGTAVVEADGNRLAKLSSGDYFGEQTLFEQGEPRTATVAAVTSIDALKIRRENFQKLKLQEKLEFPKREKINRRHKMMAAGSAGVRVDAQDAIYSNVVDRSNTNMFLTTRLSTQFQPQGSVREQKSYWATQCEALKVIFCDKVNATAFILVPIGQLCVYFKLSPGVVFFSNFLAIVPLASILGQATEALSLHTGQLIGGLLNATFGNAVEMIMCIQAVRSGLIIVVQGNLLGSILSNLLLVLGMAIMASGMIRKSQEFNTQGAAANMTCQLVASISVCLPTVFASVSESAEEEVLMISRICSLFLMALYTMFLYFMLQTHADLFADEGEEEDDESSLSVGMSTSLLLASTLVVFFCSEGLVDSIEGVSEDYGLSKTFIGVILLPIVGNAAEHSTAVTSAYKGNMDLALGVAVGSSTQIALFVVPCAVVFGWVYDQPMNLNFTMFEAVCQILTVFLVSQVLGHGTTNWLHGVMLVTVYLIIAVQTLFMQ